MNKITTTIIFFFLVFSFWLPANTSLAQGCRLSNVVWGKSDISVGEEVTITVNGRDCMSWGVSFNIYEKDIFGDDFIGTVQGTFANPNSLTVKYIFTESDYKKGGDEASGESMIVEAVAGQNKITSSTILNVRSGPGGPAPGPGGPAPGPGGPVPGEEHEVPFEITNPIKAESLTDLVKALGRFIFQIAIPIAVILIIYSGILFLISQGNQERIAKAKTTFFYTLIGLTIVLIGKGFITLIRSILELGK